MAPVPEEKIEAPFSHEQVDRLNRYQRRGGFHGFECVEDHGKANRTLFATVRGWICPHCDYTQNWAHALMARAVGDD